MTLEKKLLPLQPFVVNLNNLARGTSRLDWHADAELFKMFENSDILDADLSVDLTLVNRGVTVYVDCCIEGSVTVQCDRCLEDLRIGVETSFEETYTPEGSFLDLSQDIYDYVCISLPLQRVHQNEEQCNEQTTRFLSK